MDQSMRLQHWYLLGQKRSVRTTMALKLSNQQVTEGDTLAARSCKQAALNIAIAAFNQVMEPFSRAVGEALEAYNAALERARTLADGIVATAQAAFDAWS